MCALCKGMLSTRPAGVWPGGFLGQIAEQVSLSSLRVMLSGASCPWQMPGTERDGSKNIRYAKGEPGHKFVFYYKLSASIWQGGGGGHQRGADVPVDIQVPQRPEAMLCYVPFD